MICERLSWLGGAPANASNSVTLGTPGARVDVFVIPTDEEQVITDEAYSVLYVGKTS
jgi:acetate kinase